jgi:predicted nucleic acid-binding protein
VLACALESKAVVVVTGDNDLLSLSEFEGVQIVTPRQFIELLDRSDGAG